MALHWEELAASDDLLSTVVMAHLETQATCHDAGARLEMIEGSLGQARQYVLQALEVPASARCRSLCGRRSRG